VKWARSAPFCDVRGGADKFLAGLERKQATATKLGIYATYSPRSPIHVLDRCSNFCMPLLKKKIGNLSVQPGLRGSNDLRVGRKMANFQVFFSVQETGGSPAGPDPENRVCDHDTGSPGRPVSSGLQVPGEPEHCRTRTGPLDDPKVVQTTSTVDVIDPRSGIWRPASRRDSACPNLHE